MKNARINRKYMKMGGSTASLVRGLPTEILEDTTLPPHLRGLLADAHEMAQHALAANTRLSYRRTEGYYTNFCEWAGIEPFPADPHMVTAWLLDMATPRFDEDEEELLPGTGLAATTIETRLAGLNRACEARGHARPGDHPTVRNVIEGIRRTLGMAPTRETLALTAGLLRDVVENIEAPTLTQLRDRAMVIVANHPGVHPGQLARLRITDVVVTATEATVTLPRRSRNGKPTQVVFDAVGTRTCAVAALTELLAEMRHTPSSEHLFCRVGQNPTSKRDVPTNGLSRDKLTQAIRRNHSAAVVDVPETGFSTLSADQLVDVVDTIMAPNAETLRDTLMLVTGFVTAGRRSNVCALKWSDCVEMDDSVRLVFRVSKNDQRRHGQYFWLPAEGEARRYGVDLWNRWRTFVAFHVGFDPVGSDLPLFPALDTHGNLTAEMRPFSEDGFVDMLKRRVAQVGVDPTGFSGHSLRFGFITSMFQAGFTPEQVQRTTYHRDINVLLRYRQRVAPPEGGMARCLWFGASNSGTTSPDIQS